MSRRHVVCFRAAAGIVCGREALHDTVPREHPSVGREILAHHERPHGGVLLRQGIRYVGEISLVLTAVDQDQAGEPARVTVALVRRILPPASSAETYESRFVSPILFSPRRAC